MDAADRIIVPLDVSSMEAALSLVDSIPDVTFWKVGLELFVSTGPAILTELKARQKRIFLDLKLHDIPNTMVGACRAAAHYGVDLITLHATAGREALMASQQTALAAAAAAGIQPPQLIAVTVLTSISNRALALDLKIPLELDDFALQMALMAEETGLSGIVCSPQEAALMRRQFRSDFVLVCPGVRPSGVSRDDQQRAMAPQAALQAGATYLVIGRPITAVPNPAEAFQRICDDCNAVLAS